MAKLIDVCWLGLHGRFDIKSLSIGILYQVSFLIRLKDLAYGWKFSITIRLEHPEGRKQDEKAMDKDSNR